MSSRPDRVAAQAGCDDDERRARSAHLIEPAGLGSTGMYVAWLWYVEGSTYIRVPLAGDCRFVGRARRAARDVCAFAWATKPYVRDRCRCECMARDATETAEIVQRDT